MTLSLHANDGEALGTGDGAPDSLHTRLTGFVASTRAFTFCQDGTESC